VLRTVVQLLRKELLCGTFLLLREELLLPAEQLL